LRSKAAAYFDQTPKNYQPERHVGLSGAIGKQLRKIPRNCWKIRHFSPRNHHLTDILRGRNGGFRDEKWQYPETEKPLPNTNFEAYGPQFRSWQRVNFQVFFVAGLESAGEFIIPWLTLWWRTAIFGVETPPENPN